MSIRARRVALTVAILSSLLFTAPTSATVVDEQALIVSIAQEQLGKSFRLGSNGPSRFDCSGLVYYVFERAGLENRIGGKRYVADEFFKWGQARGLVSRENPRVGDLVLWKPHNAAKIKHMGIYIGEIVKTKAKAKGKVATKVSEVAISALTIGVSRHKVHTISMPFYAYIHVGLGLRDDNPPPTPTPTPTPTPAPTMSPTPTPTPTQAPTPDPNATPTP